MKLEEIVDQRFAVERLAGAGGMSVIYRAEDLQTGAPVALKVLLHASLHEEELRFQREALAIAEIDHPGVVRHVAHGTTAGGEPYLAMEWVDGEDLATRLRRGRLSVAETMTLGLRLAEALGAAHERGVVHRDLKPSNIMLAGDALGRAKIVDFGLATFPTAVRATLTGVVLGTPAYMAPEQARGERMLDGRVDVFALGCVLHECLTGKPAFDGWHAMAVLAKIVFDEVPRLSDLGVEVPAALDELLGRMLAKQPEARPGDGSAVATALRVLEVAGETGAESGKVSSTRERLTRVERRLLAVVLAREPPAARAQTMAETVVSAGAQELQVMGDAIAAVEARGGHAVTLADGTIVVTATGTGLATDQAALAAGCALALRGALPGWAVAMATGRAEVGAERPVGDAIERAARRIRARQRAGASPVIDLDDVTAGLLDLRFDVTTGTLGLELHGERDVAEGARTLLGRPTAFVGREREMATLAALFAECEGEPAARAVILTAPAGMGKSRLRHELVERLRARGGVEIWIARGDPMRAGAPFGMLAPLLRRVARLHDGEPLEARRQKLLARVSRHVDGPERLRVAELLGELVGTPFPDEGRVQLRAARQDPRLAGDQMRRAFLDLVDAETAAQPLVLVLEDMHWGDKPSAAYVDAALRRCGDRPLFCLALGRPDLHDRLPGLWHDRALQDLRLPGLPRRACERLARDVLGEGASPWAVVRLWQRSGGNPFFLEELLRAGAEGRSATLPETMLAMIESRLESLDSEDRRLLRAASTFGDVFWRGGLAALLGSEARLDAQLRRLEVQEWLVSRPDARFGGEVGYAFRHALVREGAYGTLTGEDRALGHRLAGAWLAAAGEGDAFVLAEHFERGGELPRAAQWYAAAAEQALEANDLASVVARAEQATALGVRGEALARAALARAIAHNWRGERVDAEVWANRAVAELPEGSGRWCAAMGELIWTAGARGDVAALKRLSDALVAAMPGASAPGPFVAALSHAVTWLLTSGEQDHARAIQRAVEPIVVRLPDAPEVEAAWLVMGGFFAATDDDPMVLRELLEAVVTHFEEAGDQRQACFGRANLVDAWTRLGAYDEAEAVARAALAEAERLGLPHAAVTARHGLGLVLLRRGVLGEAIHVLREAATIYITINDQHMEGVTHAYLAEALRHTGDLDAAEGECRSAVSVLEAFPPYAPFASATLADVLLARGRVAEALEHAQGAHDLLASLGKIEEGEALVRAVYVEALIASGRHDDALAALAEARARLLGRAARIRDEAWRRSFLENVPENARTLALAGRWLPGKP